MQNVKSYNVNKHSWCQVDPSHDPNEFTYPSDTVG